MPFANSHLDPTWSNHDTNGRFQVLKGFEVQVSICRWRIPNLSSFTHSSCRIRLQPSCEWKIKHCQCWVAAYHWYHTIVNINHFTKGNQTNPTQSGHKGGQPDGLNGLDKGLMTQTRSDVDDEGTNLNPCDVSLSLDMQWCARLQAQENSTNLEPQKQIYCCFTCNTCMTWFNFCLPLCCMNYAWIRISGCTCDRSCILFNSTVQKGIWSWCMKWSFSTGSLNQQNDLLVSAIHVFKMSGLQKPLGPSNTLYRQLRIILSEHGATTGKQYPKSVG